MHNKEEFRSIYKIVDAAIKVLEGRLLTEIDRKVEAFRRAVVIRSE